MSDELAAPVGEPFAISSGVLFDQTARVELGSTIALPAVKRRTRYEVRFFYRAARDTTLRCAGRQVLVVYPTVLLRELRTYGEEVPIVVDDPRGRLAPLLESQEVAFVDVARHGVAVIESARRRGRGHTDGPREPMGLVLRVRTTEGKTEAGSEHLDDLDTALLRKGYCVVRFREGVDRLPAIVIDRAGAGVVVDVGMLLLDSLAEDPQAQTLLLEIIRRAAEAFDSKK